MHLLVVTPIFAPSTGGAATYYHLLVRGLLSCGIFRRITVVTERVPGQPNHERCDAPGLEVIRLFPHRAGGHLNKISTYARYGIQNLLYASIPNLVRQRKPDVILIHSSFHNFFNLLGPVVRYISKRIPVIADVRDHQLPPRQLKQLEHYHALIACSLNVHAHISQLESLVDRTTHIPVLQERLARHRPQSGNTLAKHGLTRDAYFLFAGLIKPGKGIELLLKTYESLRSRGFSEQLVLVGLPKDASLLERALAIPGIRSLGAVSRDELLDLMSCSRMVINLSGSEGMPRTSLEALALGVRTLLPKGIPEFDRHCPESVACSSDPDVVAAQIENLLLSPPQDKYPIDQYAPDVVLSQYHMLFERVCSRFYGGANQ